jgi:hypothetical protein
MSATKQPHLAANLQPESQKLLLRARVTTPDRDFSQEDQKERRRDRRRAMGGRAAAGSLGGSVARLMARRAIKPSETF